MCVKMVNYSAIQLLQKMQQPLQMEGTELNGKS